MTLSAKARLKISVWTKPGFALHCELPSNKPDPGIVREGILRAVLVLIEG
jgi:hypothetical protein